MPKAEHLKNLQFHHPDIITPGANSLCPSPPFFGGGSMKLMISSIISSVFGVYLNEYTNPPRLHDMTFLWIDVFIITRLSETPASFK